ncbi:MAG: AsmA family protein, partial [Bacteroidia bacterium]
MRKIFFLIGAGIGLFLLLLLALPFFFSDSLHAAIQKTANEKLRARLHYQKVGISFFRHFPALTVSLHQLTLANIEPFEKDTLISLKRLDLGVDVWKLIQGKIDITRLYLIHPRIHAHVLDDGTANWDITYPDTTTAVLDTSPAKPLDLTLHKVYLEKATLRYQDQAQNLDAQIQGLDFTLQGDFSQEVFTAWHKLQIDNVFLKMENVSYLTGQSLFSEGDIEINLPQNRYAVDNLLIKLNRLPLKLSGNVLLPDSLTTLVDMRFEAPDISLREVLTLIPAIYQKDLQGLKMQGKAALHGFVKGTLRDSVYPAFDVQLTLDQGRIQSPQAPKTVEDLSLQLRIHNPTSDLENTEIIIPNFRLRAGQSQLALQAQTKGIEPLSIRADLKANAILQDFSEALPLGYELRGKLNADLHVEGIYDAKRLPSVSGQLLLQEGYVKAQEFPAAIQDLFVQLKAQAPQADPAQTTVEIPKLTARIDNDPLTLRLKLHDMTQLNYDLAAEGTLDLAKWTQIFPLDSARVEGLLSFALQTQGNLPAIEKQEYARLPAQGNMKLTSFRYTSLDPQTPPVQISEAMLRFSPQGISLEKFQSVIATSDITLRGEVKNYLGYLFQQQEIQGNLVLESNFLDLNPFMHTDTTAPVSDTTAAPMEVYVLPKNIDFTFSSQIARLIYDKMNFQNVRGKLRLKDQKLTLENLSLQGFGGNIAVAGSYKAPSTHDASWDMTFQMREVNIAQLAQNFYTLRRLAPIATLARGSANLDIKMASRLKPDMMPDLPTLNGEGLAQILQAVIEGAPSLQALANAAKNERFSRLTLQNTLLRFKIRNGGLELEPTNALLGSEKITLQGKTLFDGSLDFSMGWDAPAAAAAQLISLNLPQMPQTIRLVATWGGTLWKPKFLGIRPAAAGTSQELQSQIREKLDEEKRELERRLQQEKQHLEQEARRRAEEEKRRAEEEA